MSAKCLYLKHFNFFGERTFSKLQTIYWARKLKNGDFYEKEIDLLPCFIQPGSIAIDIGANFGQYTYPLSKLVGSTGKVFSIEPVKYNFEILKNIVKKLNLTNVELQNIALGDKNGEVEIITPVDNSGLPNIGLSYICNSEENKESKRETVKILTLDELTKNLPSSKKVKFVKCDVEGAEMMVFAGGKNFLSEFQPIILCEIEERHTKRYNYNPDILFKFLKNLGYEAFILKSGKLIQVQEIKKFSINYIFIHKSVAIKNETNKSSQGFNNYS